MNKILVLLIVALCLVAAMGFRVKAKINTEQQVSVNVSLAASVLGMSEAQVQAMVDAGLGQQIINMGLALGVDLSV